jgi:hypothetical protein
MRASHAHYFEPLRRRTLTRVFKIQADALELVVRYRLVLTGALILATFLAF